MGPVAAEPGREVAPCREGELRSAGKMVQERHQCVERLPRVEAVDVVEHEDERLHGRGADAGVGAGATARLPVATIGIFGDVGSSGGNEPRGW